MMLHVGIITPEYPFKANKERIGGIGIFTKSLAERLVKENIKVSIFIHSQKKSEVFVEGDVTIHRVKMTIFKGLTWYVNRYYFNKYVNKVIKDKKIDVLEAPEWTGFTAFMNFDVPLVLRLHGSDTYFCQLEKRKVKFKNRYFEKNALKRADRIVGVSKFVSDKTKSIFNLNGDIKVIYNTVNLEDFKPNHTNIKPKSLLYFGTVVRKKGVLEIAKVFNKLIEKDSDINLTIIGSDNKDILTKESTLQIFTNLLSEEAKEKFTYLSSVPYSEIKQYIQRFSIVLLPSFAEAFPMTWIEAMAFEKKLITSDIGWAKELMINNHTGFCVNPRDTIDFTNKVMFLLQNEEEASKMGANARKRISENFNYSSILKQNIDLYTDMLS